MAHRTSRACASAVPSPAQCACAYGQASAESQRRRRHHHTDEAIAAVSDHGPVTQATVPATPADAPIGPPGQNQEERLDEALQESFPSSDPVSIHIE